MFEIFQKIDYHQEIFIGNWHASMDHFINVLFYTVSFFSVSFMPLFLFCYMGYLNGPDSTENAFRQRLSEADRYE